MLWYEELLSLINDEELQEEVSKLIDDIHSITGH
jgi:hypothetical protein